PTACAPSVAASSSPARTTAPRRAGSSIAGSKFWCRARRDGGDHLIRCGPATAREAPFPRAARADTRPGADAIRAPRPSIAEFMPPPLLSLRNASVRLGSVPLFEGLTAAVGDGDRICLVGRNGAGKSTLLKALAGLV